MRILGIDTGADSLKVASGPDQCQVIPNYLDTDCLFSLLEPPSKPHTALHLFIEESPCGVGGEFAFGHLAEKYGGRPMDPRANKMTDMQIRYSAVAALFLDAAQTRSLGIPVSSYGIEVGLPMIDFKEPARRPEFGSRFKGTYRGRFVETSNPKWAALGEIRFTVDRVLVGCEGAPALAVMPDPMPYTAWRAVVDIGGSSLEIATFEDEELQGSFCAAAEIGVNNAMEELTRAVNHTYIRDFSRAEVARILTVDEGQMANGSAQRISLHPLADRYLYPVAKDVANHIYTVWRKRPELSTFEMIGGGSVLLKHHMTTAIKELLAKRNHQGPVPFTLRYVPNARQLNALGFYAQAKRRFGVMTNG